MSERKIRNRGKKSEGKNIALILGGGIGARTKLATPKQFVIVCGKPIIVYTLEEFNRNWQIDEIVVVVLDGWQTVMERYIKEYQLHKVKHLVKGGASGQESIRNGLELLSQHYHDDDIILIHDGVRPLVDEEIINQNISKVLLHDNAVTVVPSTEVLLRTSDAISSDTVVDRSLVMRTQTPQSLRLRKLKWAHAEAAKRGIKNTLATCSLLIDLGETVHFAEGSSSNLKITTGSDIRLFEAYIKSQAL